MIHITKDKIPEFLSSYISKNPDATYESPSFKPFHQVLRNELVKEQKGLCAYCCSRITLDDSHNEHIEPQHMKDGSSSRKSLDYYNLVASCNSVSSCGIHKKNDYNENSFISPINEDCEKYFSYDPDGYINGDKYTISLLNLNSYELRSARKAIYKMIMNMSKEDIRLSFCSNQEEYWPFSNVILWYLNHE